MTCSHCGAPLRGASGSSPRLCTFCGVETRPQAPAPFAVIVSPVVAVAPSAPAAVAPVSFNCPRCDVGLVSADAQGLTLHGCGVCGGIWLDNAATRAVVDQGPLLIAQLALRAANNASVACAPRSGGLCPVCAGRFQRAHSMDVVLDVCAAHGTWFDAAELSTLIAQMNRSRRAREAKDAEARVICIACRKQVPASESMVTATGAACDPCYRAAWSAALTRTIPG